MVSGLQKMRGSIKVQIVVEGSRREQRFGVMNVRLIDPDLRNEES